MRVSAITACIIFAFTIANTHATCVANIAAYPGWTGTAPSGTVVVGTASGSGSATILKLTYDLANLGAGISGGVHIHTGKSCAEASGVGGHYWATVPDLWIPIKYGTSNANGASSGEVTLASGLSLPLQEGHTIVLHTTGGARTGCGVITCTPSYVTPTPPPTSCSATISTYPGSSMSSSGDVTVTSTGTSTELNYQYALSGLTASVSSKLFIATGVSCANANYTGYSTGGYYISSAPSSTYATSSATGTSSGGFQSDVGIGLADMSGRVVLVDDTSGPAGCGVLTCTDGLSSDGLSTGAIAGISVGAALGGLLLLGALGYLMWVTPPAPQVRLSNLC